MSRCTVKPVLAPPGDIEDAIGRNYGSALNPEAATTTGSSAKIAPGMNPNKAGDSVMDTDTKSALAEVVALQGAGKAAMGQRKRGRGAGERGGGSAYRASRQHHFAVGHQRKSVGYFTSSRIRRYIRVRFRIDGVLHEVMQMPGYIKLPLIARYKNPVGK